MTRRILALVAFLLCASAAHAANSVYISQAGGGTGASCASALAASYFNTSGNWSSTPTGTQIGPGTTVFICGVITTNLTFQGNGSASGTSVCGYAATSCTPVILDGSQSGAFMDAFIDTGTQYWWIQNITWGNGSSGTGNGPGLSNGAYATNSSTQAVIQTQNGAAFGTIQNNHMDVMNSAQIIFFHGTTHDILILNNYLRIGTGTGGSYPSYTGGDGFDTDGIDTEGGYNVIVQGNYIEMNTGAGDSTCGGCHNDLTQVWGSVGSTHDWRYLYNEFVQNSSSSITNNLSWTIFEQISQSNAGNWDLIGNVFVYLSGGTSGNGSVWDGNFSGMTAHIYNNTIVGKSGAGNNLFNLTGSGTFNLENNIIYSTTQGNACTGSVCTSATRGYNLWFGSPSPSCSGFPTDLCGSDPLFTNYSTDDFSLQSTSPARSLGTNLGTSYNQYAIAEQTWPNPSLGTRPSSGSWDSGYTQFSPGLSLSVTAAAFGTEIQNKLSPPIPATLTNTSGSTITITGTPITGTNASDFSSETNCGSTLASGSSCVIAPMFDPTAAIGTNETGTLTINYTGFSGPTLTVSLTGTSGAGGPQLSYAAETDLVPVPYNGGAGTIPCPGSGGCISPIISTISVTGTAGTVTFLVNLGSCPFGASTTAQINGNSLIAENKLHTIATCSGTGFTYSDGVATGSGTDGVATAGGALTGSGTVIKSDFPGVTLIRITDNVTPSVVGGSTPGKNGFVTSTTGSAETCQWDISDQRFVIQEVGNINIPFQFNPTTLAFSKLYGTAQFDPNGGHEPTCSHVTPFLFYNSELVGSDLSIVSYDTTSTTTAPTIANGAAHQIVDLNVACGASLPTGLVASNDEPGVSVNDDTFSAVGQTTAGQNNTIVYMISYNRTTGICDVWNRQTGVWYVNGVSQGLVTIHALSHTPPGTTWTADTDSESIHQMRQAQHGDILWQTIETCLPSTPTANCTSGGQNTAWQVGTATAYQDDIHLNATAAGNHEAIGLGLVVYGRSNCPSQCDAFYSAPLTNGNTGTLLNYVPGDPAGLDVHPNYTNNLNDTSPFFSAHTQDNAAGLPQTFNPQYAWRNEITGQSPVPPYPTYRMSHTYVSTMAPGGFPSWAAVLTTSQDGKFILFSTDWACMLGANNGTSTVANCSNNGTYNARQDVFLAVLPGPAGTPAQPWVIIE